MRLYTGINSDGSGLGQVRETFQAGTIANGFVGVVSTVPFRYAVITLVPHGVLYDSAGTKLPDSYYLALDNTRFAQPPTAADGVGGRLLARRQRRREAVRRRWQSVLG